MDQADAPVVKNTRKASSAFVWIFAAFGFVASLTQIATFFGQSGRSDVSVRITPQRAAIQQRVLNAVEDTAAHKGFLASTAEDEAAFYCKAAADKKAGVQDIAKPSCDRYRGIQAISRVLTNYAGETTYFLEPDPKLS